MSRSFMPTSLSGRLLVGALVFVIVAIGIAGLVNAGLVYRFVRGQVDGRLDAKITAIAGAMTLAPDGMLSVAGALNEPPFDRVGHGWYWQAATPSGQVTSASLAGRALVVPDDELRPRHSDIGRPWPADIKGPFNEQLVARVIDRMIGAVPVRIVVTAPRGALTGPLRDVLMPLLVSMLSLACLLLVAVVLGVRRGLYPLGQLSVAVAAVRTGRQPRLPGDGHPVEVAPLVAEINTLLDRNEAGLERARRHVANLAHGLKTPLTTLAVTLAEPGRDPDNAIAPLVAKMERLIRHHLARARSAALSGSSRQITDLAPRLVDLAAAMKKVHADRVVTFNLEGLRQATVACDAQDCDELFGNLLDNAFRHAAGVVRIMLEDQNGVIRALVEDDGPGLGKEDLKTALGLGQRLDESRPGYGFGLPIAAEIAELQGGNLTLGASALGGLCVTVELPIGHAHDRTST